MNPIQRGSAFVDFTIAQRLPKIAADVGMAALAREVVAGGPIELDGLARPTAWWSSYLDRLQGARWDELPFFDLEFVFYHSINSRAGFFTQGTDVFARTREAARVHGSIPTRDLASAVWLALLGNEADYSQLQVGGASPAWESRLVVDERARLLRVLESGVGTVHVLADNAGPELHADLGLVEALLARGDRVVIHVKPWPMFVSDALASDVLASVRGHAHLTRALDDGHFAIVSDPCWGEPRHFDALEAPLLAQLRDAKLVLAKGDLNYRRFVGDRAWPLDTPVDEATRGVGFEAFALRVLKSDALVGVSREAASQRAQGWRTDGTHALVQRISAGPSP
ncbi:MAG: ARMT1-like domain-containing protein [Polyangiales bacterium]